MSTPALLAIGTPLMPGSVEMGADVVFIGCGHEEPCPEMARPCSVDMYRAMELMQERKNGLLVCRPEDVEDPRHWPMFERHEISSPEAVAKYVARVLNEAAS